MATSSNSAAILALTRAHQTLQAREAAKIAALVVAYYRTRVQIEDPASVERWLSIFIPRLLRGRDRSALTAATYAQALRQLEVPEVKDSFRFEKAAEMSTEQLRTSLMVTGIKDLQTQLHKIRSSDMDPTMRRAVYEKARSSAETAVAGAAARHVLNGGRDTLREGVKADPVAIGFARVTKGDPCYFCAMLASRGPVYQDDSFDESDVRFSGAHNVKVHDSCACSIKPQYRRNGDPLEEQWKPYQDLWNRLRDEEELSGRALLLAFRAEHEGRPWRK